MKEQQKASKATASVKGWSVGKVGRRRRAGRESQGLVGRLVGGSQGLVGRRVGLIWLMSEIGRKYGDTKHVTAGGVEVAHQNRYSATATQLNKRVGVVRPHCRAGDVILFDARILHFGVANQNADTMRPLLFVNYNRPWFSDYQPGAEVIVRHR